MVSGRSFMRSITTPTRHVLGDEEGGGEGGNGVGREGKSKSEGMGDRTGRREGGRGGREEGRAVTGS